ncbi:MAG: hypothetical protein ABSB35_25985 [Bryobacteraceae bacterium]
MGSTAANSREQLRSFHITGRGLEDLRPLSGLRPAIFDELDQMPSLEAVYPAYVAPGQLPKALAEIVGESAYTAAIVAAFRAAMGDRMLVAIAEVRDAVFQSVNAEGVLDDLGKRIPAEGWLVPFRAEALPLLYAATLAATRGKLQARFFDQVKQCFAGVEGLLAVDDAHRCESPSSEQISASLGMQAAAFFNLSAMSEAFSRPGQKVYQMDPERRARCESTLATLAIGLREHEQQPLFWLFHSGPEPSFLSTFGGECRQSADSCAAALDLSSQQLEWLVPLLRAMRVARLEVDSAFDPAVHAQLLERFEWETADPEELAALPAVVVMEPADRLARMSLTSFSRLLRSGRAVQSLAPTPGLYVEDLSGAVPDFGYLSIAHREAVVVQSSLASLSHLLQGLLEVTGTLRPAVAVVSVPEAFESEAAAWLETSLYILSRTFPIYRYDPNRTQSRERFELFEPGPQFSRLKAAHVAALSRDFQRHFRVIPDSAWDDEQMEIDEYLAKCEIALPLAIPYLWITNAERQRQRAVITRELVNLCRDRSRAWEIFTELAGTHKTTAQDASQTPYEKARREGVTQTIQVVLAMLADPRMLRD